MQTKTIQDQQSNLIQYSEIQNNRERSKTFDETVVMMNPAAKHALMKGIGKRYRQAKVRVDMYDEGVTNMSRDVYQNYRNLIYIINRILQEFTREERMILRRTFFEVSDEGWYKKYYSTNTYKSHLQKAVDDFLQNMDYLQF